MIVSLHLTKVKRDKHMNLLYLEKSLRDDSVVGHFVWIKNLSRLLGSQLSMNSCTRSCRFIDCARMNARMNECTVILSNENDKWLSFRNYNRKKRLPFVVYADLECILEKRGIDDEHISRFTYQHHKVFSIGYYVRCAFNETMSTYRYCRGANCVAWFVDELYHLTHRVKSLFVRNSRMNQFTTEDRKKITDATNCHICEKPFEMEHVRVRNNIPLYLYHGWYDSGSELDAQWDRNPKKWPKLNYNFTLMKFMEIHAYIVFSILMNVNLNSKFQISKWRTNF
ncbi:hypothetical protein ALC62_07195 [Cyphomyrmex costatus]|uniref:Uncharacterized protein n=1 Tax=Cyphomyrmex costatus TaxID=456900 RepID=A0A151IHW9_9HYME|nr:hypothetical protein ALC62_07195 [Cyphomyrmex costatus]